MQSTMIEKIGDSKMNKIFDTLKYTKRATAAGLSQQAAEFHAEELAAVIDDSLVTKDHLSHELLKLEHRMTWKLITAMTVIVGLSQTIGHFFK